MWFLRSHSSAGGFVQRKQLLAALGLSVSHNFLSLLGGGLHQYHCGWFSNIAAIRHRHAYRRFTTALRGGGTSHDKTYILGIGSNLGDRYENIRKALQLLSSTEEESIRERCSILRTSFLYETPPMYMTEQPPFLNAVLKISSELEPLDLLRRLKEIERDLGRDLESGVRNGPRPVDLDILFCKTGSSQQQQSIVHESETLTIPHPRIMERAFVLQPLLDVILEDEAEHLRIYDALQSLPSSESSSIVRVVPMRRNRLLHWNETLIMGVLNVTPDSFSDGDDQRSLQSSVQQCLTMEEQGAHVIDIGGESTRPGAKEVEIIEELQRTIPVIQAVREASDVPISIDTRHAAVAKAAVDAGADIVNDVSGGMFDEDMLPTVGHLGVPLILMHMRGTPETMQDMTDYSGGGVVKEITRCLQQQSHVAAEQHGIYHWLQILDPGIGFAKDMDGNLELLGNVGQIRQDCGSLPILLGTSRKGFLGKLTGLKVPNQRDPATVASCVASLALAGPGPAMLRVHNVAYCHQATKVLDAILNRSTSQKAG